MKETIIHFGPRAEMVEIPIHEPKAGQVLIKVVVSGSNPKDWKMAEFAQNYDGPEDTALGKAKRFGINQGDDIAGVVEKVGPNVVDFKVFRSNQNSA
jgi:NADPH:quinone reductase-like Zn-dependent oxidoreductase